MKAMTTLDDAERLGYLVTTTRNRRLPSSWRERCRQHNRPYVVVKLWVNRKWATVEMDLWPSVQARRGPLTLTKGQQERLTHVLEDAARKAFAGGATDPAIYASAGLDYASVTVCRPEDAPAVAEILLDEALKTPA